MKTLELEITNSCNEKCLHCYHPQNREVKFLKNLPLLDKALSEFGELGFIFLTVTGGEPLLHPEFREICKLAQKHRYLINIKTNGTLIDESFAQFFKEVIPSSVEVSLYSADKSEHDFITQVEGSFEQAMDGVKILKENGVRISVMTPLLKGIKQWKELYDLMEKMDVPWGCSPNVNSSFDNRAEVEKFKGDYESYLDFLQFVTKYESQKVENIDSLCFKECGGGVEMICIAPDYSTRPCISFPESVGIYEEGKGAELLKKAETALKERFAKLECHNCELVKHCGPCPAHLQIVNNTGICDSSKRDYALAKKHFYNTWNR
ncbi:MAG: radical SAM/SPASM domain-containing protein [bacterium]